MCTSIRLLIFSVFILPVIAVSQTSSKPKVITLSTSGETINNDQFYFKDFIDERSTKDYIGQVQKGMMNKKSPLSFEKPIHLEFLSYLNYLMPASADKKPLSIVLHQLWATEKTTFSKEIGMLDIAIEIRSAEDGTSYGTYSHYVENGGMDVTNGHEKRIKQGIVECVQKFLLAEKAPDIMYTSQAEKLDIRNGIPNSLKKGFYNSFASIEYNRPDSTDDLTCKMNTVNDWVTRYMVKKGDEQKKHKEYAYYTGEQLLLNSYSITMNATYYLAPHTTGRYMVYVDKYSRPGAAVAFGAIGAAASTKTRANILDLKSGIIREIDEDYMDELLRDYPELEESYQQSNQEIPSMIDHIQRLNDLMKEV